MKIYTVINPEYLTNIYFITDDDSKYGVIIDPGSFDSNVYSLIKFTKASINKIIITHNDKAQTAGIPLIKKIFDAEIYSFSDKIMGFDSNKIRDKDIITEGKLNFRVIDTKIHSLDSISVLIDNALFIGDIFQAGSLDSIDKTKEPADYELKVIKEKILNLDDNTIIYPGQGPATTLEIEKKFNPYFRKILSRY